jgi:16S rRNA processing protein RimM
VGAALWIQRNPGGVARVTVGSARFGGARPVVAFDGCSTIEEAERFVGLELRVPETALTVLGPGTYYEHQLVGCAVETQSGEPVGSVGRVDGGTGGPLLVVEGPRGEVLIPLTASICVEIDVTTRRIRVAPPEGLIELNDPRRRRP